MEPVDIISEIEQVFERFRTIPYLGEAVTQLDHARQSAREAEKTYASDELITAALLHDIGHMVHGLPLEDENYVGFWNQDDTHEIVGEKWLARAFPDTVTKPVRWHVAAKRFLAATDPEYKSLLTAASLHVLELQGGPMSEAECAEFEGHPWAQAAIAVRRWDDKAKTPGRTTPSLEHYLEIARRCIKVPAE
ncbi:MAG: HD domain-containing protein [Planctomycetes bacterium]|nr:HD domain-containing protein [Planctomycetota bacterium]